MSQKDSMPISRQCKLLGISRSGWYYKGKGETALNQKLMRLIDEEYLRHLFLGARRMKKYLKDQAYRVNRKRIQRLMRQMGIEAIYPKPSLSLPGTGAEKYPYLLRGLAIDRPDQVWCTDITYVRLARGFAYLTVIMDWHSRYVLSWDLSNTLDSAFCVTALERALRSGRPGIFNTDQGAQFTSHEFTGLLKAGGIHISMDGRGRAMDNIFIERLWRTVKYDDIYLRDYQSVQEAYECLNANVFFSLDDARQKLEAFKLDYNTKRPHSSLGNFTPMEFVQHWKTGLEVAKNLNLEMV